MQNQESWLFIHSLLLLLLLNDQWPVRVQARDGSLPLDCHLLREKEEFLMPDVSYQG